MGEEFEFRNGYNTSKENYGVGVPFVNVLDVITHLTLAPDRIKGKVTLSAEAHATNDVRHGDVLFNRTSETPDEVGLTSVYVGEEVVTFGGFVIRARPLSKGFDPHYLSYSLRVPEIRRQIIALGNGAIRSNVGQGDLQGVLIPKPPLPEQRRIAAILGTWDKAISNLAALIATKQRRKQGLMQELLSGRRRFPGFKEKWKEVRLGELANVDAHSLGNDTSPTYAFRYISLSDVDRGRINGSLPTLQFASAPSRARRIVKRGEILMATVRPNLQAFAVVPDDDANIVASTGFAVIAPKEGVNGIYLYKYLFSPHLTGQINSLITGSNYPSIGSEDVRRLKVRIPCKDEQDRIAKTLLGMETEINYMNDQLTHLTTQKRGLMQQLLTGRIRTI